MTRAAVSMLIRVTGERTDQFRTASQIHDDLRHEGRNIGLTTVYRTLQMMTGSELDVIRTDDGEAAYRRCSTGHHHRVRGPLGQARMPLIFCDDAAGCSRVSE